MKFENQIILGDCKTVMSEMPDSCIDLVVTSPPYDGLRDYNGYSFDFEGIARELFRVIKEGGVVVWVVGDAVIDGSESGTSFKQALFFKEVGFNLHDTMIYQKVCVFPDANRYLGAFEYMFVLSKGKPKTVNFLMDRQNKGKKAQLNTYRQKDGTTKKKISLASPDFGRRENIWKYITGLGSSTKDRYAFDHPAIFPEKLASDHITSWSNKGDVVLDPFNGSGTTTKMAKQLNRRYIGIDVSKEYCEIAELRLKQDILL